MIRILSSTVIDTMIVPQIRLATLLHSQGVAFNYVSNNAFNDKPVNGTAQCPARIALTTPGHVQLFMPARTPGGSVIKVVSVPHPDSGSSGIPGVNLVLDDQTGQVTHVVNSTSLTALRTAAGSLISSILALGKQEIKNKVENMVVFGDGAQAIFHTWLHLRYFNSIQHISIIVGNHRSLTNDQVLHKAQRFQSHLDSLMNASGTTGSNTQSVRSKSQIQFINASQQPEQVRSAVAKASIIVTCTPSRSPLFSETDLEIQLQQTRHICAVGSYKPYMCELASSLINTVAQNRTLWVDSQSACAQEAGCLLQALDTQDQVLAHSIELATLLPSTTDTVATATHTDGDIDVDGEADEWLDRLEQCAQQWKPEGKVSVFKSVGVGLQDVEITKLVVALAGNEMGTTVEF